MKDLRFICAQPDDTYSTWQVHLWLERLKNIASSIEFELENIERRQKL